LRWVSYWVYNKRYGFFSPSSVNYYKANPKKQGIITKPSIIKLFPITIKQIQNMQIIM
ncbi:hypothetical protein HG1285_08096, partial [Hydrogenivirga sp. 128-5-R1-1]